MSEEIYLPEKPSLGRRVLRFVVRMVFVILVGIGIGVALYFGVPWMYQQYIQPVQEHSAQIEALELRQVQSELLASQTMSDLQARLQAMESQSDMDKQAIAELKAELAASKSMLDQLMLLEPLAATVEQLQDRLADTTTALERLQTVVMTSARESTTFNERLRAQVAALTTAVAEQEELVSTLNRDVQWAIITELLVRARYSLTQDNLSLAASDISAAIELLEMMKAEAGSDQVEALVDILAYLEDAQAALPRSPLVAADNLESAWQLIIDGLLTDGESLLPAAPVLTATVEVTSTITATATLVGTPTETPSPTPTP